MIADFKQAGANETAVLDLRDQAKQSGNELILCLDILLFYLPNLPPPDHMYRFISTYCPPSRWVRKEP
jgi:hypothetical protein